MDQPFVKKATFARLPAYLDVLKSLPSDCEHISATAIAKMLSLGEVQVRKDLAAVSGAGKPKLGYVTKELILKIEECLGVGRSTPAVLVGAGRLGRALLQYDEFNNYGIDIKAAFDINDKIIDIGLKTEVFSMNQFEYYCKTQNVRLGIITVGKEAAQNVCDKMVKSGITAVWNFAPVSLKVPDGVILQNENLALSLAHLNNRLNFLKEEEI